MLSTLLHIFYVPVCVFLILVVLLQTGKRADLAGAFGGGGSQTAFGARGAATLLAKVTTASAVLFMIIALALAVLSSGRERGSGSVLDEDALGSSPAAPIEAPAELPESPVDDPTTSPVDSEDPGAPAEGSETGQPIPEPEGDAPAQ
jgi:preprotein translocase subunit SecG